MLLCIIFFGAVSQLRLAYLRRTLLREGAARSLRLPRREVREGVDLPEQRAEAGLDLARRPPDLRRLGRRGA